MTLGNKTPAEAAGIGVEGQNKWMELLNSSRKTQIRKSRHDSPNRLNFRKEGGILFGAGAAMMLVALLILQSSIGSGLLATRTVTSVSTVNLTTTTTITQLTGDNQTWETIELGITSPGIAGYQAECRVFAFPCPSENYPMPAILVLYNGSYYYVSDLPVGDAPNTLNYTVWYTNSTVFCVTPVAGLIHRACP